ncbi:hypothetical protein JCM9533A_77640 [Catenuloplanes niger JCM 9533]
MREALRARATVGEVCHALRDVWVSIARPRRSENFSITRTSGLRRNRVRGVRLAPWGTKDMAADHAESPMTPP